MKKINFAIFLFFLCFVASATAQDRPRLVVECQVGSEVYPGIESGEVYLTTISTRQILTTISTYYGPLWFFKEDPYAAEINFAAIKHKTKRLGKTAYWCSTGEVLTGFRPVFISKKEWEEERNKIFRDYCYKLPITATEVF